MLLGRYQIEETLGSGGFGTVVKAFDSQLKRTVAIKSLNPSLSTIDPTQYRSHEERFRREAEAGARMGVHSNLVAVYDQPAASDGTLYLCLEYVSGGTLADRLRGGALPLADALRITEDAARGLLAAHVHGIVHRDVKPANIFLAADGHAKVGDFGIAQIDDLSGRTSTTAGHPGTPLYMSPEQEHSSAYVRPSSDQYSLGLVLFEIVTGRIYKRLEPRQAATLLAQQPAGVAALVQRMIASDSGERFESMADVIVGIGDVVRSPGTISPGLIGITPPLSDDDITTRHVTPHVNLSPGPFVAPPPRAPSEPQYRRRAVLIGVGVLAVGGGAAGLAATALHGKETTVVTVTPQSAAAIATATMTTVAVAPTASDVPPTTMPPTLAAVTLAPIIPPSTPVPTILPPTPAPPTSSPATAPPALSNGITGSFAKTIKVGTKDFTEEFIVGNMYKLMLEQAGAKVNYKENLGGTPVCQAAMQKGDIDLYPEYTGTGLATVLKQPTIGLTAQQTYDQVAKGYKDQYNFVWLAPAPMNDTQALAMTQAGSQKFGVKTISDMVAKASQLTMIGPPEFQTREDGLPNIMKAYGTFKLKQYLGVDFTLKYRGLINGQADVAVAFATDGDIAANRLVMLQDDKHLFPVFQITPVVTQTALNANPGIWDALNKVSPLLTDKVMATLNYEVDSKKREPAAVAKEFLTNQGLLTK